MVRPLEILGKMLELEARDYAYNDRAVAGGLARYVETWRRQARELYGDAAMDWIEQVAQRLHAYSSLDQAGRRQMVSTLQAMLKAGPEGAPVIERPDSVPAMVEEALIVPKVAAPVAEETRELPETVPAATPPPGQAPRSSRAAAPPVQLPSTGKGLDAPVMVMTGIGERRSELLSKLNIETIRDFLRLYPRRYEDYSQLKTINRLEYGERVSLLATVWEAGGKPTRGRKHVFRVILSDNTGTLEVTWFNQSFLEGRIRPGMQLLISGKVDEYLGRLTMNSPEWEIIGRTEVTNARIQPIYPLTEGLTQRWMRSAMRRALGAWATRIPDALPDELRMEHQLLPLAQALWGVHLPDTQEHLTAAQRRMAFEQVLYLQLGLLRQKLMWKSQEGRAIQVAPERVQTLQASLPYALTGAQSRTLDEMLRDCVSGEPMNRLLQGDVGSGKTVVAALLMALTVGEGYQAALMAPTEILAEQHYRSLSEFVSRLPEPRPIVGLLTGSVSSADRALVYEGLANGKFQIVVGTHALIQEAVSFKDLALVVIDEQHRFGVEQRRTLRDKGYNPHLLVMTATPIPRSLELTIWGHVDVSVLDEMPPGRQVIQTRVLVPRERGRAYTFIESQIEQGRQAFIIYPLVEASDKIEARAAVDEYARLQKDVFPNLRLGLLHGRMRSEEKDAVMGQFAAGKLDILIATSVVEVGIDVPNASVMLIDGAERFGLAQLHQFRGRVGRGPHQSYCLLLAAGGSDEAHERLQAVEATNDGFALAEKDLQMRGPGEFLGTQQSGFPEMPMAAFADMRLLHEVREAAMRLLDRDPELSLPEHRLLRERVAGFWEDTGELN
jgi:ATP-dependent DNA helicase RecG